MQTILEHVEHTTRRMRARPVVPHPGLLAIEHANGCFARRFQLVHTEAEFERFLGIKSASCASHAYVGMPNQVVMLAADLIGWMFLFDDRFGEGGPDDDMRSLMARFASYESVMLGGIVPRDPTPFHVSLADLRDRGVAIGGAQWQRRWAANMARYFDGCVLELPYRRARSLVPTLVEYRQIRSWTVGTMACFTVSELGLTRPLSEQECCDPGLLLANELAAMLTAWVNDVYSYHKEFLAGDSLNLVTVLAHEHGLSVEQAFRSAAELYNEDLELFESTCRRIRRSSPSSVVSGYLEALGAWIHGNHAWTGLCRRYHTRQVTIRDRA